MRTFLCFVMGTISVFAQDWTPRRIVAIADYVPLARQARISGDIQVKCFLDADGSVLRAAVLSGHPLLREQARKNALLWKFQRMGPQAGNNVTLNVYPQNMDKDWFYNEFVPMWNKLQNRTR